MANERLKGKTLKVTGFLEELEKDTIKDKIDIVALFREFGVELKQKGKGWTGLCPFHDDKTPSLSVDREKGLYNCFGCGESGDVVTLVEKMKHLTFKDSLKFLQHFVGAVQTPYTPEPRAPGKQAPPASKPATATHDVSLTTIADFYHKKLFENKAALEYLERRGFKDTALFTRFKLGYADGSLLNVVSNGQREALKVLGILRETGTEHLSGCITFPIFDEHDQAVSLYGRRASDTEPKHLYLAGPHRGVWNRKASKVYDEIILAESIIDALSLVALGFENVQALYGTNGFTDEHLQTLRDDRVKTVVLAFDADEAGRKAAGKLKEKLLAEGFAEKTVEPSTIGDSTCKDWNEFLTVGGTKKDVAELVTAAAAATPAPIRGKAFTVKRESGVYEFTFDEISYRLMGVREVFVTDLKVNITALYGEERFPDKLDLYAARARTGYAANLGNMYSLEPRRIERDLIRIVEYLENERDKALAIGPRKARELTSEERELGLSFLRSPGLVEEIVRDLEVLGYMGEDVNKLLLYLTATSRLLDDPISVLILSESSAGKSLLVELVARLIPEEDVISVTSLSDQALNYAENLEHKFLHLSEAVHSNEIERQIREMLSGKVLSRFVAMKDEKSGKIRSELVRTPAIVSLVMSTTDRNINPENASRFFVVNADESRKQTSSIFGRQEKKRSLERYQVKKEVIPVIIKKHHAAQRLLRNIVVINELKRGFEFPDRLLRARRDHDRFMDLIAAACFLRQYQKAIKKMEDGTEYIECDRTDYEIACKIMASGILSSTMLEFPKHTIELYETVRGILREKARVGGLKIEEVSLTQRDIREKAGLSHMFVKRNLRLLCDYEYLKITRPGTRGFRGSYGIVRDEPISLLDLGAILTPDDAE
jgi:DNA primase catalytic core